MRKVILEKLQSGIELKKVGVTIRVENPEGKIQGHLRIGKRIFWKPAGKIIEIEKSWEELIRLFEPTGKNES
jgi:hypothetical protein